MELIDRRPFTPDEIRELEANNPCLRGDQKFSGTHLIYESLPFCQSLNLRSDTAAALEREFRAIADWHTLRGRPELTARYQRCAENFASILRAEAN